MPSVLRMLAVVLVAPLFAAGAQESRTSPPPGVVCRVKVLSDKVPDMTNLETWKKAYIKDGMTDAEKALIVWKTVRQFQHQDAPPNEFLHQELAVQDPLKIFNVYGYSLCSIASCDVECLARYAGLKARGRIINSHSVPEVYVDGAWRLIDSSLLCYFPKADGSLAGVDEIMAGVKEWYDKNPGFKKNDEKLRQFMRGGGVPGCLTMQTGKDSLRYTPKDGDLAPGRVGNGTLEYDMPVTTPAWRGGAFSSDNLEDGRVRVKDGARPGVLVVRMPTSYVYLTGKVKFTPTGPVAVSYSDNNGMDWKEISNGTSSGPQEIDLSPLVLRRYDYRLKFELKGKGAGLDALRIEHDIQNSQRALPAFDKGRNTLTFTAGSSESTITVEGCVSPEAKGKNLLVKDFHPEVNGFGANYFIEGGKGDITFPVSTPGDMTRLRFGSHYRARDAKDGLDYQVSFDGGKTWKTVARAAGPTPGDALWITVSDVPAGTREAKVRYSGTSRNATGFLNFRIDADYKEPAGGFRPVKVTYRWDEEGKAKEQVFVAKKPEETWTVTCGAKPVMKSIVLELAE